MFPLHWYLVLASAVLLPVTAIHQHIRLGKSGLTPARLFLTFCNFAHLALMFLYRLIFEFLLEFGVAVLIICLLHFLAAYLISVIYRVGNKGLRIFFCILCPLLTIAILALAMLILTPTLTS